MDSHRPLIVSLSVQLDILVTYFLQCLSNVESHHGTYHRNGLYRSKRKRPPNSNSGTCILGNRYRVSGTSVHGLRHYSRHRPILPDHICHPFQHRSVLHRRSKPERDNEKCSNVMFSIKNSEPGVQYLLAFEADIIRIAIHSILWKILVICSLHYSFILQPLNSEVKEIIFGRYFQ